MTEEQAAIGRALALLEAFSVERPALTLEQLAEASGVSLQAISPAVDALAQLGYLRADGDATLWRLGARNIALARSFLGAYAVREVAHGHMEALAIRFRAVAALAERSRLEMVYIDYVRAGAPVVVEHRVGSRLPIAVSAAGRAWLCTAPAVEVEALVGELQVLHSNWPQLQARLQIAREDLAARGFTRSYGEVRAGVNSVAVPLRSPVDRSLVVFSLAIQDTIMQPAQCDAVLGPALKDMVAAVERELVRFGRD